MQEVCKDLDHKYLPILDSSLREVRCDAEAVASVSRQKHYLMVNKVCVVDHFLCYKGKPPEGTKFPEVLISPVTLVDQFIDPADKLFDIGKPKRLCNPVSKEFPAGVVTGIQKPESHLMCYSIKRPKGDPKHERTVIFLNDQFGPTEEWQTKQEKELCLPATKTLP